MDKNSLLSSSTETFADMDIETMPGKDTKEFVFLIVGCSMTVGIILLNILLAASLLIGKNYNTFTLCVFHLVALDLAVGTCVFPLSVSLEYNSGTWLHGRVVCSFWITLDFFLTSLILTTCLVINIERILDLTHSTYRLWRELWTWKHFLFIWLSWLAAIIVGVPIFFKGTNGQEGIYSKDENTCYAEWQQQYELIFHSLMLCVPALLVLISLLIAVVCSVHSAQRYPEGVIPISNGLSTTALILVNLTTVSMILPLSILMIINKFAVIQENGISFLTYMILHWISLASSAVRPIMWLLDPEVRSGYGIWYRKCCKGQTSRIETEHGPNNPKVQSTESYVLEMQAKYSTKI